LEKLVEKDLWLSRNLESLVPDALESTLQNGLLEREGEPLKEIEWIAEKRIELVQEPPKK
jgi:hypothetical protein